MTTSLPSLRPRGTALLGFALPLALAGCLGGGGDGGGGTSRPVDRMAFETAQIVKAARVLDGDPDSARCPDTDQPCLKDNRDILDGQRILAGVDDMQVAFVSQPDSGLERRLPCHSHYSNEDNQATTT